MPCLLPFWKLHYDIMGGDRRSVALRPLLKLQRKIPCSDFYRNQVRTLLASYWFDSLPPKNWIFGPKHWHFWPIIGIFGPLSWHSTISVRYQIKLLTRPGNAMIGFWFDRNILEANQRQSSRKSMTLDKPTRQYYTGADTSNCSLSANVWRQFRAVGHLTSGSTQVQW